MFGGVKMKEKAWKELIKEVVDNKDGKVFKIRNKY